MKCGLGKGTGQHERVWLLALHERDSRAVGGVLPAVGTRYGIRALHPTPYQNRCRIAFPHLFLGCYQQQALHQKALGSMLLVRFFHRLILRQRKKGRERCVLYDETFVPLDFTR